MLTVYLILPALLVAVVMASVWLERWSVPVILVALGTGIVCGSDVLKLWQRIAHLMADQPSTRFYDVTRFDTIFDTV